MLSYSRRALLFLCLLFSQAGVFAQYGQMPPFTLTMKAITGISVPGLHSFAHARSGDKWLFIGGRTNGLHGLNSSGAFPPEYKNDNVIVIDTGTWAFYSASLNQLPLSVADPMRSTNMQYVQSGDYLYMTGGYGYDSLVSLFVTFPMLTAVHVDSMITAVMNAQPIAPFIRQVNDTNMAVCGGEMGKIGNDYYLVTGHNFGGRYTDPPSPLFTQVYNNRITRFNIADDGSTISLSNFNIETDTMNFHRRDLNLGPVVNPDGTFGLTAYGGVFQKTEDLPYLEPIYITASGTTVDMAYQQKMSHYNCALLPMYDSVTQNMYTTFFGGISLYDYNPSTGLVEYDSLCPFVSDVTTMTKHADGTVEETVLPLQLPARLGSNAKFIINDDLPLYSNEVIRSRDLPNAPVLAGYFFGGIRSDQGNFGLTVANDTIYRVYISPPAGLSIAESSLFEQVSIYPSPSQAAPVLSFSLSSAELLKVAVYDITGREAGILAERTFSPGRHQLQMSGLPLSPGIYFCSLYAGKRSQTLRFTILR